MLLAFVYYSASTSPSTLDSTKKLSQLFWGLFFSFIGDACLIFPGAFLCGIISFAVSQGIYISLFGGGVARFQNATRFEILIGLIVISISCGVYTAIFKHMNQLIAVLAALYCVLISTMLWSALIQASQSGTKSAIIGALGSALFYLSDLLLSVNKWGKQIPYAQILIMTTYYCAQILITGYVLK